jgi:hypothetical protein
MLNDGSWLATENYVRIADIGIVMSEDSSLLGYYAMSWVSGF